MKVQLFATCLCDLFNQEAVLSTARVLRRLGHSVDMPEQTCCGQPAWNSGFPEESRPMVASYLRAFRGAEAVVAPSGSCVAMLHEGLRRFFPDSPEAEALSQRTYELTDFLWRHEDPSRLRGALAASAAYHESCHLSRWLQAGEGARRILAGIEGLELRDLRPQRCCGFGGTFAVHFPELSVAMADEKLQTVAQDPPDLLVAADEGCLLQLGGRLGAGGSRTRPIHIAQLLDEAGVGR